MKDPKTILLYLATYLTICSGIYHMTYWWRFDLNGLQYISVTDIAKSAIAPLIPSILAMFITLYVQTFFVQKKVMPRGGGRETKIGKAVNKPIGKTIVISLWIALSIFLLIKRDWLLLVYIIGPGISLVIFLTGFLKTEIPDVDYRDLIIQYMVYIPLFSFAIGRISSDKVYKNTSYKYTLIQKNGFNDTIKLIGETPENIFFTDMTNSRIIIIKGSSLDTLTLYKKE